MDLLSSVTTAIANHPGDRGSTHDLLRQLCNTAEWSVNVEQPQPRRRYAEEKSKRVALDPRTRRLAAQDTPTHIQLQHCDVEARAERSPKVAFAKCAAAFIGALFHGEGGCLRRPFPNALRLGDDGVSVSIVQCEFGCR